MRQPGGGKNMRFTVSRGAPKRNHPPSPWPGVLTHLFCLLAATLVSGSLSAAGRPPNFVIIFSDDLGWGDLSIYGSRNIHTPRLDRMATEGVRLMTFYSAAPTCSPARAALLTGRYPQRSGLVRVLISGERVGLPLAEITLAEALKEKGYATATMGKWHLGDEKRLLAGEAETQPGSQGGRSV